MKECNKVFLGAKGISSTSATHLADVAKEQITGIVQELAAANYITSSKSIIGCDQPIITEFGKGDDYVKDLRHKLDTIAEMHAFNAWVREAVKAKDDELNTIRHYDVFKYCEEKGIEYPRTNTSGSYDMNDAIGELNIKERNEYLTLQAIASTYGEHIHPGGDLHSARKAFYNKKAKPTKVEGKGRETTVEYFTSSITEEVLETMYNELQAQHRSVNARLNRMKAELDTKVQNKTSELLREYSEQHRRNMERQKELYTEFTKWQNEQLAAIGKLKVVIPEALEPTKLLLENIAGK